MEKLNNGYELDLSDGAFPLSTDSIALAAFAKLRKNSTVLDLGSGCGTLGLLLCAEYSDCTVTGIEISEEDHKTALQNAADNGIPTRLNSICADASTLHTFIPHGGFSACISNPPYFTGGPLSKSTPSARKEDTLSIESLFRGAAWSLRYGGDFYLVHRPERLAEVFATAVRYSLEPKELQLLRHQPSSPVALVLIKCRKGAKPGLKWDEQYLHEPDGSVSAYYKKIYHL